MFGNATVMKISITTALPWCIRLLLSEASWRLGMSSSWRQQLVSKAQPIQAHPDTAVESVGGNSLRWNAKHVLVVDDHPLQRHAWHAHEWKACQSAAHKATASSSSGSTQTWRCCRLRKGWPTDRTDSLHRFAEPLHASSKWYRDMSQLSLLLEATWKTMLMAQALLSRLWWNWPMMHRMAEAAMLTWTSWAVTANAALQNLLQACLQLSASALTTTTSLINKNDQGSTDTAEFVGTLLHSSFKLAHHKETFTQRLWSLSLLAQIQQWRSSNVTPSWSL